MTRKLTDERPYNHTDLLIAYKRGWRDFEIHYPRCMGSIHDRFVLGKNPNGEEEGVPEYCKNYNLAFAMIDALEADDWVLPELTKPVRELGQTWTFSMTHAYGKGHIEIQSTHAGQAICELYVRATMTKPEISAAYDYLEVCRAKQVEWMKDDVKKREGIAL